jgi:hypothetical protein
MRALGVLLAVTGCHGAHETPGHADMGGDLARVVRACPSATGTWEDITPAAAVGGNKSTLAFVIDPHDTATVYLGTAYAGMFKSSDCGASWVHINSGRNGAMLDNGMEGSMVIDPVDPNTIYVDNRYGVMGLFKSSNGGVDWDQILPTDIAKAFIYNGMVEWIAMDPSNHLHLIVSPHFSCQAPHPNNCMLESEDGGTSWRVIDGTPDSTELGGQMILDDATWLWAQPFGGLWRTADHGASWKQVYNGQAYPYLFHAPDGTYYVPGGNDGLLKSSDGIAWEKIAQSPGAESLAWNGTTLYTSNGGFNQTLYSSTTTANPMSWKTIRETTPPPTGGWMMQYDGDHHILYSSNFSNGFWRFATQ